MRGVWRMLTLVVVALAVLVTARTWRSTSPLAPAPAPSAAGSTVRGRAPPRAAPRRALVPGLVVVRGRVVADDGAPVREAEVRLFRRDLRTESLAEVEVDDSGDFEAFVPPGAFELLATAPDFLEATGDGIAPGEPVTVTMYRAAALVGRVVRADTGEPVPDATVTVDSAPVTAVSDADGRFRLDGLLAHRYAIVARASGLYGRAPESVVLSRGETSPEITIALRPAATLRGRLELATTHEPCPKGRVALVSDVLGTGNEESLSAAANEGGDVIFPALLPGRYEPRLTCAGHAYNQGALPIDVGEAPIAVTFAVQEELGVRGVVVDEAGAPVSRVEVRLNHVGAPTPRYGEAASDGDGRFEIRGIEAGTYEVTAEPRMAWGGPQRFPEIVTVAAGIATPELRLVLARRHRLEGRVLDEQGRPLSGAYVHVHQSEEGGGDAELDESAHFSFEGLLPGKVHLSVSLKGTDSLSIRSGEAEPTLPFDHELTLVVAVPPRDRIEGRVIGDAPLRDPVRVEIRGSRWERLDLVWTDRAGRFSSLVPAGASCTLSVTTDRGETADADHVTAGSPVTLRLRAPATLRGRLHGAPRTFQVSLPWVGREETFSANDGSWELRGVPARKVTVKASAPGLVAWAKATLAPGETRTLDLRLVPSVDESPNFEDEVP